MQPGAVAVAGKDKGAGARFQHEGEVFSAHDGCDVLVDALAARDLRRHRSRKGGLAFVIAAGPVTTCWSRASSWSRTCGRSARAVPRSCAVCGMTLSVEPAWNTQMEITAASNGSTLRATIDWI